MTTYVPTLAYLDRSTSLLWSVARKDLVIVEEFLPDLTSSRSNAAKLTPAVLESAGLRMISIRNVPNQKYPTELIRSIAPESAERESLRAKLWTPDVKLYAWYRSDREMDRIWYRRKSVETVASVLQHLGPGAVAIVTNEEESYARKLGIAYTTDEALPPIFHALDPQLLEVVRKLRRAKLRDGLVEFGKVLFSLLSTLLGGYYLGELFLNFSNILVATIRFSPIWAFPLGTLLVGSLLYKLRSFSKLVYGTIECGVGIAIAFVALNVSSDNAKAFALLFQVLGALYVVVRGLDNIGKWIDQTGRWRETWIRLFGPNFK